jgi:type IV pilus assembly protein PilW
MTRSIAFARGLRPWARRRGMSIVELMVGITIGLFILSGATLVLTSQLGDNRRLLLEAQMQQDMRATADMVARDLRRAAYWARAYQHVWPAAIASMLDNPYQELTQANAGGGPDNITYDRSTDEEGRPLGTDDNVRSAAERVGFRLNRDAGTVEIQVSEGNWQALTDPAVLRVTRFDITLNTNDLPLPCGAQCPTGPGNCPLFLRTRDVTLVIVAQAVHEPTLRRTLRDNIRLRNDVAICPVPGP